MEVTPTPCQEDFIQEAIKSGRIHRPEDAAKQALSMWEENERRRLHILAAVDQAEASFAQGKGKLISSEEQITELVEATKQRGVARLLAEQNATR